jgi:hypothetical protein
LYFGPVRAKQDPASLVAMATHPRCEFLHRKFRSIGNFLVRIVAPGQITAAVNHGGFWIDRP